MTERSVEETGDSIPAVHADFFDKVPTKIQKIEVRNNIMLLCSDGISHLYPLEGMIPVLIEEIFLRGIRTVYVSRK